MEILTCSFCGKPAEAVEKLISTPKNFPTKAYICDECIEVCAEILFTEPESGAKDFFGADQSIRECLAEFEAGGGNLEAQVSTLLIMLLKRREAARAKKLKVEFEACERELSTHYQTVTDTRQRVSSVQSELDQAEEKLRWLQRRKSILERDLKNSRKSAQQQ